MFKMALDRQGECDTCSLGYDGINAHKKALFSGQPYDLIIIDIILPDINGQHVLECIRTEEIVNKIDDIFQTKIILTTSLDDEENRKMAQGLKKGKEAYYIKSFANEGLREILMELGFYFN